jgi:hypothetical protein
VRPEFDEETYGAWWGNDYPVAPYHDDPMADDSRQVVAFSSRGPTRDGRVKPEVIAPGTYILSTRSTQIAPNNFGWAASPPANGLYFYMGGTSMAKPLVAGAAAVVREHLRKKARIARPSAALIKAALILGAGRLAGVGAPSAAFDNDQGFGRVNVDRALTPARPAVSRFVDARVKLSTGDSYPRAFDVRSNRVPLKLVLAFSDYPGLALVNNLNLIARSPEGRVYAGNRPAGGTLDMDTANNVEVIEVARPTPGRWRIVVVGSNVPHGPQGFALACRGDLRV